MDEQTNIFLKKHLPGKYTEKVLERLGWEDSPQNRSKVTKTRCGHTKDSEILLALVKVARENRENKEKVKNLIA